MVAKFLKSLLHKSCAVLLFVFALGIDSAQADPGVDSFDTRILGVDGYFKESLYSFSLIIRGTEPVTKDAFEQYHLGAIWKIDFSIRLVDENSSSELGTGLDSVLVSGTAQHIIPPHAGEGAGGVLQFSYIILPSANSLLVPSEGKITFNGKTSFGSNQILLAHGSLHEDLYSGSVGGNNINTHLVDWSVSLSGAHPVPEPDNYALALVGLIVVGMSAVRRRG